MIFKSLRSRILYPFLLAMMLLVVAGLATSIYISRHQLTVHMQDLHTSLLHVHAITQEQEAQTFATILDILKEDEQLVRAWMQGSRKMLLSRAQQLYQILNARHQISHFYFHQPDKHVFLRVHHPERYSDKITRSTLQQAVENGQASYGLEVGVLGSFVLRYVVPWYINDKLVGYIELGKEVNDLLKQAANILDLDIFIFIDKSRLIRSNWESFYSFMPEGSENKTSSHWDAFPDVVMTEHTSVLPPQINTLIRSGNLHTESSFNLFDTQVVDDYSGGMLRLFDVNRRDVGYLLFLHNVSDIHASNMRSTTLLVVVGAVLMMLIVVFLYRYLGKIDKGIAQSRKGLEDEIERHKQTEVALLEHKNELEVKNAELESFSYSIAHDLRAPLRSIVSFSQIVKEDAHEQLQEADRENLQRVIDAGRGMAELIDDILQLARMTRHKLQIEDVDLAALAQKNLDDYLQLHPERNIKLQLHGDLTVRGDRQQLELLLANLLGNAFKYSADKPVAEIELSVYTDAGKDRCYAVKDNGVGFDMRFVDKIFKPFQRLHVQDGYPGTGVGLAIVQRIVDRHHGRIWVESSPGGGSTFYFSLCCES